MSYYSLKVVKKVSFKMVTENQLQKSSAFLKSLRHAKDGKDIKKILKDAAIGCLKVLLSVIKACVEKHIPLQLTEEETKKIKSYKSKLRNMVDLKSNKITRY
jgi:hypothetical protein